jgi:hypothetical protein
MADVHAVALTVIGARAPGEQAARDLAAVIPGARVDGPDDVGIVTLHVEAADREDALRKVWDAVAASGVDEHLAFAEHAEIPRHWQPVVPPDITAEGNRHRVRKFLQQVKGTPQPDVDIDRIAEVVGITHGEAELYADELVEAGELIRDGDTYLLVVEPGA